MTDILDFRSDTVTLPTEEMREAMSRAFVGDDVYGEDPTVNELQEYAAGLAGKEAALYVCSGTMGNLVSIMTHCARGEGVLMGSGAHTWLNETGNVASVAGVMPYPVDDSEGIPAPESIKASYRVSHNVHFAHTTLLALENTHNSAGGVAIGTDRFSRACRAARELGLSIHLDGARIFNACAHFGVDVREYTAEVDSVQICLSKGLAAPMGSVLCGGREFIERAKRVRKALGGGQRQAGIAAAAGIIALRDMRARLGDDHRNAARLAELLAEIGLFVEPTPARTNMVYFGLGGAPCDVATLQERCRERGLLIGNAGGGRMRMVTHLGLDGSAVERAASILKEVLNR